MFAYASLSLNKTMTVMKIRTNHLCPLKPVSQRVRRFTSSMKPPPMFVKNSFFQFANYTMPVANDTDIPSPRPIQVGSDDWIIEVAFLQPQWFIHHSAVMNAICITVYTAHFPACNNSEHLRTLTSCEQNSKATTMHPKASWHAIPQPPMVDQEKFATPKIYQICVYPSQEWRV